MVVMKFLITKSIFLFFLSWISSFPTPDPKPHSVENFKRSIYQSFHTADQHNPFGLTLQCVVSQSPPVYESQDPIDPYSYWNSYFYPQQFYQTTQSQPQMNWQHLPHLNPGGSHNSQYNPKGTHQSQHSPRRTHHSQYNPRVTHYSQHNPRGIHQSQHNPRKPQHSHHYPRRTSLPLTPPQTTSPFIFPSFIVNATSVTENATDFVAGLIGFSNSTSSHQEPPTTSFAPPITSIETSTGSGEFDPCSSPNYANYPPHCLEVDDKGDCTLKLKCLTESHGN